MSHERGGDVAALIGRLTLPEGYPMTPEAAALEIVNALLGDLSEARQKAVRLVIETWGTEWGSLCSSAASESTYR